MTLLNQVIKVFKLTRSYLFRCKKLNLFINPKFFRGAGAKLIKWPKHFDDLYSDDEQDIHAFHRLYWIIDKNQIVTIEHQVGNILINTQGIAQEPGQLGEKIWVSNVNSGKKVLCWIKNDKKVSTNPKIY